MVSSLEIGVLMGGLEWIGYKVEGADVFVWYRYRFGNLD